jgi:low-affinity ferrous iron transport protein
MIVEGSLLLVLFQAHNLTNITRREEVGRALERRGRIGSLLGCPAAVGKIEAGPSSRIETSRSVVSLGIEEVIKIKS